MTASFVLFILAYLADMFITSLRMYEMANPHDRVEAIRGRKVYPTQTLTFISAVVSQFLVLVSLSNVPLVWTYVVFRTQSFNMYQSNERNIRIVVRGYQIAVLLSRLVGLLLPAKSALTFTVIGAVVGVVAIPVVFLVARTWINNLMKKLGDGKYSGTVMRRINFLTRFVSVCFILSAVSLIVYAYYTSDGPDKICHIKEMCTIFLWRELTSLLSKYIQLLYPF